MNRVSDTVNYEGKQNEMRNDEQNAYLFSKMGTINLLFNEERILCLL